MASSKKKNYKNKITTKTDAKKFYDTVQRSIESEETTGTKSSVAKDLGTTPDRLRERIIETYGILGGDSNFQPLEFEDGEKKEKTLEKRIKPTKEEDGSITINIPKDIVEYLSLDDEEDLILKVKSQEGKLESFVELIGKEAFARNEERRLASSKESKKIRNLLKNNGVNVQA